MKYTEGKIGRVFVLRLEDGDVVHACIEKFAADKGITGGGVLLVGGVDAGSKLVVGPKEGRAAKIEPMHWTLDETHEIAAVGTIFPDETGVPVLHMHGACGRGGDTRTGCVRTGIKTWHIGEVIIYEITGTKAVRKKDPVTGFALLQPAG